MTRFVVLAYRILQLTLADSDPEGYPTSWGALRYGIGEGLGAEEAELHDVLMWLRDKGYLAFRKWDNASRRFRDFAEFADSTIFSFGEIRLKMTLEGRSYVEELAKPARSELLNQQPAMGIQGVGCA